MQEYTLFKNQEILGHMEEILYIWAKENPDFKYQQGMNEILAVILVCLISELTNKDFLEELNIDMNSDEDTDEATVDACKLFMNLHNPEYLWANAYLMFNNIMNLGVKELYYKETTNEPKIVEDTKNDINQSSLASFNS